MRSDTEPGRARLALSGELDIATAPRLEDAVRELLAEDAREMVIDLSGITFIDSTGLRQLIVMSDRAARNGRLLRFVRPPEPSLSVLRITGAERSLPFLEEPPR